MATETWTEIQAGWAAEKKAKNLRWSLLVLIAFLAFFVWREAAVHTRIKDQHAAAQSQWNNDRQNLWASYTQLSKAASSNDDLAYGLVLRIANNDLVILGGDAYLFQGNVESTKHAQALSASRCIPATAAYFRQSTSQRLADCEQILKPS